MRLESTTSIAMKLHKPVVHFVFSLVNAKPEIKSMTARLTLLPEGNTGLIAFDKRRQYWTQIISSEVHFPFISSIQSSPVHYHFKIPLLQRNSNNTKTLMPNTSKLITEIETRLHSYTKQRWFCRRRIPLEVLQSPFHPSKFFFKNP